MAFVDNTCCHCGVDTWIIGEYYMVTKEVWETAGGGKRLLCVGCLEKRLKRQLTAADFPQWIPLNVNVDVHRSQRLQLAMQRDMIDA